MSMSIPSNYVMPIFFGNRDNVILVDVRQKSKKLVDVVETFLVQVRNSSEITVRKEIPWVTNCVESTLLRRSMYYVFTGRVKLKFIMSRYFGMCFRPTESQSNIIVKKMSEYC